MLPDVGRFSDGEIAISINEVVRGSDVFIIQSTCTPVNDNLVELLILIDALRKSFSRQNYRCYAILDMPGRTEKLKQGTLFLRSL